MDALRAALLGVVGQAEGRYRERTRGPTDSQIVIKKDAAGKTERAQGWDAPLACRILVSSGAGR